MLAPLQNWRSIIRCRSIGPDKERCFLAGRFACAEPHVWAGRVRTSDADRWLEEGETVQVGNMTLEMLFCPGHTPGHIVFINDRAVGAGLAT